MSGDYKISLAVLTGIAVLAVILAAKGIVTLWIWILLIVAALITTVWHINEVV